MAGIIVASSMSLPRDIDVQVNISKPQAEKTTDLSVPVFCTPDANFDQDASRIRFYSTLGAVAEDFLTSSQAYVAASSFFSQSPRAKTLAIARIFEAAVAGYVRGGAIKNLTLAQWKAITTGSFAVNIDGVNADVTGISFASISQISDIATVLQTAIRSASAENGFTSAVVALDAMDRIRITSGTTGVASCVQNVSSVTPSSGLDISGSAYLNLAKTEGSEIQSVLEVPGYLPGGLADELALIQQAAIASGKFVYGWVLDKQYRDTDDMIAAAGWIEAQVSAIMGVTTNSPSATDPSSSTDVGAVFKKNGYRRSFVVYHDNAYYYPDLALLAYALSVDYSGIDTTITTKFKDLYGIPTVPLTETELSTLEGKNINTFVVIGNNSRTFREGTESNESWFIDDLINLDNFKEDVQVSVYNVFLRNKKVPYNQNGVSLLYNAIANICDKYVRNGTLSQRLLSSAEAQNSTPYEAAYTITFTPVGEMTISDRAKRKGPPAMVKLNLAGAIHSVTLNVEAFS